MDLNALLASIGGGAGAGYNENHIKGTEDFDKLKQIGNDSFKKRNYELAIKAYNKASKVAKSDIEKGTVASNASTCHTFIGEFDEAVATAELAIKCRPDWEKGYYRKAQALIGLEKCDEAEAILLDEKIFKTRGPEIEALLENIEIVRIPWTELEKNVWMKIPTPAEDESPDLKPQDVTLEKRQRKEFLEDLDTVWHHCRILDLKSREVLKSTKWHFPIQGMMPSGEQDNMPHESVTLAEYEVSDVVDMALRRIPDKAMAMVKITGPCSYYPDMDGKETPFLEFQLEVAHVTKSTSTSKPKVVLSDIVSERKRGAGFLAGAIDGKEKLDSFDRNKAAADQEEEQAMEIAWAVKKGGTLASRRFRRTLEFCNTMEQRAAAKAEKKQAKTEKGTTDADAGDGAEGDDDSEEIVTSDEEKEKRIKEEREAKKHAEKMHCKREKLVATIGLARSLVVSQHVFSVEKGDRGDFGKDLIRFLEKKGHKSAAETEVKKDEIEEALKLIESAKKLHAEIEDSKTKPQGNSSETSGSANAQSSAQSSTAAAKNLAKLEAAQKAEYTSTAILIQVVKAETLSALDRTEEALKAIEEGFTYDPKDESLRSERARLNLKSKKQGEQNTEVIVNEMKDALTKELEAGEGRNLAFITESMVKLGTMCDNNEVAWDALMKSKIGKSIGLIQKAEWSDEEMKTLATKLIRKFRDMAERNRPLWS